MADKKLVVIGGGAAGFFCAVNAARLNPKLKVVLIEKSSKLLSKVKVSGGGRCNVTHDNYTISQVSKKYPRGEQFLKKAFRHFFTTDTVQWFEDRGVALKAEKDGRMFPVTDSSQTVINCLLNEASEYNVDILISTQVTSIYKKEGLFKIALLNKAEITADQVCIACGGFPKAEQFKWITDLGHNIQTPVPSLFTFNMPGNAITSLMGISVEHVSVKIMGTKLSEEGPLLITHWGLSGPVVLKLSAWGARILNEKEYRFRILVNWLPAFNENTLKDKFQIIRFEIAAQKIINRNPFALPSRLWEYLLLQSGINPDLRWADLPAKEQNKLIKMICSQEFDISGKTTFKEEFVTAGGIKLEEVDIDTMQSRIVAGLYFAGEILDVDGITGGFNFQNAWTTGWIAAKGINA